MYSVEGLKHAAISCCKLILKRTSTIALTVFIWLCKGNGTPLSVHGKLEQYACSHVSWGPPTRYLSLTEVHSSYERLRDNPTKLWLSCSKHFLSSLGWHIHWRLVQICNPVAFWHFASRSALQSGGNLCSMLQISQAGTWSGTFPCFLPQSTRQPKQILSENFAVSVLLERSYARLTKKTYHLPPGDTLSAGAESSAKTLECAPGAPSKLLPNKYLIIQGVFFHWYPPKSSKYKKLI